MKCTISVVFAANLQRRNISPEQKAALRDKLISAAAELKAEGKTQAEIATLLGVNQATVSRWVEDINDMQAHIANNDDKSKSSPGSKPKKKKTKGEKPSKKKDRRVKIDSEEESEIHARVKKGESQDQRHSFSTVLGRPSRARLNFSYALRRPAMPGCAVNRCGRHTAEI